MLGVYCIYLFVPVEFNLGSLAQTQYAANKYIKLPSASRIYFLINFSKVMLIDFCCLWFLICRTAPNGTSKFIRRRSIADQAQVGEDKQFLSVWYVASVPVFWYERDGGNGSDFEIEQRREQRISHKLEQFDDSKANKVISRFWFYELKLFTIWCCLFKWIFVDILLPIFLKTWMPLSTNCRRVKIFNKFPSIWSKLKYCLLNKYPTNCYTNCVRKLKIKTINTE